MDLSTVRHLAAINRRFYAEHGEAFARTRPRLAPGVLRVLGHIGPEARVLEVGCGAGQVGRALARQGTAYLGLDASPAMMERARMLTADDRRRTPGDRPHAEQRATPGGARGRPPEFRLADLMDPTWPEGLPGPFDWVLAFAVFHHLPGEAARLAVLRACAWLLAPGGRLAMSNWQIERSPRLKRLRQPWEALGLTGADVDPGDYLLSWQRGPARGLRYVHVLAPEEMGRLAAAAGLQAIERFASDGENGAMTEYTIMAKEEGGQG